MFYLVFKVVYKNLSWMMYKYECNARCTWIRHDCLSGGFSSLFEIQFSNDWLLIACTSQPVDSIPTYKGEMNNSLNILTNWMSGDNVFCQVHMGAKTSHRSKKTLRQFTICISSAQTWDSCASMLSSLFVKGFCTLNFRIDSKLQGGNSVRSLQEKLEWLKRSN